MWAIFLGFLAAFVIWIFDVKANAYQRKRNEKKEEITEKKDE
jgi:hypothetical protein